MTNIVLVKFTEYDRKIFWTIIACGVVALAAYVYFIGVSVFAVVGRKEAEIASGRTGARVAELESRYALLYGSIDQALAEKAGFLPIADPRYITKDDEDGTFSLRGGREQR